jgi:hypothetical protein
LKGLRKTRNSDYTGYHSRPAINLKDQYFDLKGLSAYSALKVPTLRDYIRSDAMPCFKVKGKILVKKSEFDAWVERYRINQAQDINNIVDGIMESLEA